MLPPLVHREVGPLLCASRTIQRADSLGSCLYFAEFCATSFGDGRSRLIVRAWDGRGSSDGTACADIFTLARRFLDQNCRHVRIFRDVFPGSGGPLPRMSDHQLWETMLSVQIVRVLVLAFRTSKQNAGTIAKQQ